MSHGDVVSAVQTLKSEFAAAPDTSNIDLTSSKVRAALSAVTIARSGLSQLDSSSQVQLTDETAEALRTAVALLRSAADSLEQVERGVSHHVREGWSAWHLTRGGEQLPLV